MKKQSLTIKNSNNTLSLKKEIEKISPFTGLIEPIQAVWDGQLCVKRAIYADKLYKALGLASQHYSRWLKNNVFESFGIEGEDFIVCKSLNLRNSPPVGRQKIGLRVIFVKKLVMFMKRGKYGKETKQICQSLFEWIGKETAAFYKLAEQQKQIQEVVGIAKYANEIQAAAEAIAKKAISDAEITKKRAEVLLLESPAYSRTKKMAQEQRANEVNRLLRTFAKMQGLSTDDYSDLYRSAYNRLMMYAGILWKREFWESDNKLEFLREKDPMWLNRLIDICREMYVDPTRWNNNTGFLSYYEENKKQITHKEPEL